MTVVQCQRVRSRIPGPALGNVLLETGHCRHVESLLPDRRPIRRQRRLLCKGKQSRINRLKSRQINQARFFQRQAVHFFFNLRNPLRNLLRIVLADLLRIRQSVDQLLHFTNHTFISAQGLLPFFQAPAFLRVLFMVRTKTFRFTATLLIRFPVLTIRFSELRIPGNDTVCFRLVCFGSIRRRFLWQDAAADITLIGTVIGLRIAAAVVMLMDALQNLHDTSAFLAAHMAAPLRRRSVSRFSLWKFVSRSLVLCRIIRYFLRIAFLCVRMYTFRHRLIAFFRVHMAARLSLHIPALRRVLRMVFAQSARIRQGLRLFVRCRQNPDAEGPCHHGNAKKPYK